MSELVSRTECLFENGADGFIFHGQTSDKDSDELILRFSELAASLSEKEIKKPIAFMVDQCAGNINLLPKLQKLLGRDDFPKNLDVRVAVRISTRTFGDETTLPKADLHVIDFQPLDNQEVYQRVVSSEKNNNLNVVAYMTFNNMSDNLRKAIKDYGKPAPQNMNIQGPQTVIVIHDLTLKGSISRRSPSGNFRAQITLQNGKRVSSSLPTRAEAQKWLRDQSIKIERGFDFQGSKITLAEYMPQWLENSKTALRAKTAFQYEQVTRKHIIPHLGKIALKDLRLTRIEKYYADLIESGVGVRTVRICHGILHKALDKALRYGDLQSHTGSHLASLRAFRNAGFGCGSGITVSNCGTNKSILRTQSFGCGINGLLNDNHLYTKGSCLFLDLL
jgi:hypothetical protein